jgi:elongator complex protein 1
MVNVGWGKKETQFHGSVGKQAAVAKKDNTSGLVDSDDGRALLSWRGDGEYVCCCAVDGNAERRVLRVYSRDLVLQSTSEEVGFVEPFVAWRYVADSQDYDLKFFPLEILS